MADEDSSLPSPSEPETVAPQGATSEPAQPVSEATAQIPASEPLPPEPASTPTPAAVATAATQSTNFARDLLVKARATIQFRKTAKLEKIMTELSKRDKITNDEVEKLLHVSDATATRYLSALEKQGKIKQVGKTGTAVMYTKAS